MITHDTLEQGSSEWFKVRAGLPTASCFKYLVTSTGKPSTQLSGYAETLASEVIAGEPVDAYEGNKAMQRGQELEPLARNEYAFIVNCTVDEVGFITDDDAALGCSPDGLVGDDGLIEIKCQLAKNFVAAVANYNKTGKCPADYYAQIQGQLWITGRDWCDLVLYHPHSKFQTVIIRVLPDAEYIEVLKKQIAVVIKKRDEIVTNYRKAA